MFCGGVISNAFDFFVIGVRGPVFVCGSRRCYRLCVCVFYGRIIDPARVLVEYISFSFIEVPVLIILCV